MPASDWTRIAFVVTDYRESPADASTCESPEPFEDQQRSYALLDEHCEGLARDAAAIVNRRPDARPVGLIVEATAAEAAELLRQTSEHTTQQVAGFLGVVPRALVLAMLRTNAPHALDFLEPDLVTTAPGEKPRRRLPLVAVMKTGYRLGSVELTLSE